MPTHVHRAWLATLAATALLAGGPAAAQGGEGSALISPSKALVRSTGTWRLVYTVGASGVAPGGGLRVHASGFPRRVFESPQTGNPGALNFMTASASRPGVELSLRQVSRLKGGWMGVEYAEVKVKGGTLREGDTVTLVFGDTSAGGPGCRVARGNELADVEVTTLVDHDADGSFERIGRQPTLDIVGGQAARLNVLVPSMAVRGREFEISVVAKDASNNVAMDFGGTVMLHCAQEPGWVPLPVSFPESGAATSRVKVRLDQVGVRTLQAAVPDNRVATVSVPAVDFVQSTRSEGDPDGFQPVLTTLELTAAKARPGSSLRITTRWRNEGTAPARTAYRASLHLVPAPGAGRAAVNWDFQPTPPTTDWAAGAVVSPGRPCPIPAHVPEGDYLIRAGLFEALGPGEWRILAVHLVCPLEVSQSADLVRYVQPAESNPIVVLEKAPKLQLFWGDTHVHTGQSGDGAGSVHEMYDYARDVARLDFAAASDHVGPRYPAWQWRQIQVAAAEHNAPGDFVSILGYEWSNQFHGDKNAYFLKDYEEVHVPKSGQAEDFYDMLRDHQVVVIPHHPAYPVGLRGMDWTRFDPDLVRLVEMCSAHGTAEYFGNPDGYGRNKNMGPSLPGGFAQDALTRGLRVGMIASSDDHSAHAGRVGFLAAVYARELTREALFSALRNRHCYGTSGARIVVDFRVNDSIMGSEITTETSPRLAVRVVGTRELDRVEIVRLGEVIYARPGDGRECEFSFVDSAFDLPSAWYYVRVRQTDGQRAWTSPVWVDSAAPFPDPAIEAVRIPDAMPGPVVVKVANRGGRDAGPTRLRLTTDGPRWAVVPSERQPVGGGIGGLMVRRGFQVWRYRADERSVNVFMRWGGGKTDARFTGRAVVRGAEQVRFTRFHCEQADSLSEEEPGTIVWDTNAEAKKGDGVNLWVRAVPGRPASVAIDVHCDGEQRPAEVFSRLGTTRSLPLRLDLTTTNAAAEEQELPVPTLRAGEIRSVTVPWRFRRADVRRVTAALVLDDGTLQRDLTNDSMTVALQPE